MNTSTAPRQAPRGAARRRTSTSLRRSTGVRGRARLGVVTLGVFVVLAVSLVRAPDSGTAIPEPTATAQAALLGACVALGPVHDPVTEPLRAVCVAVVLVYSNLLSRDFRTPFLEVISAQ